MLYCIPSQCLNFMIEGTNILSYTGLSCVFFPPLFRWWEYVQWVSKAHFSLM